MPKTFGNGCKYRNNCGIMIPLNAHWATAVRVNLENPLKHVSYSHV